MERDLVSKAEEEDMEALLDTYVPPCLISLFLSVFSVILKYLKTDNIGEFSDIDFMLYKLKNSSSLNNFKHDSTHITC